MAAIKLVQNDKSIIKKLRDNTIYFRKRMK